MDEESSFQELIKRVKAGDESACREIYDRYKEYIKRAAKTKLRSARMRTLFQSDDIINTVLKSFFIQIRESDNQWKMDTPQNLISLLLTMANNKIANRSRKEYSKKGGGKDTTGQLEPDGPDDPTPTPDEIAANREQAELCWKLMSIDLQELYKMRIEEKMKWSEI
ncbi:MAG: ECF-type sigma factor, partial [Pirellula sp.]